MYTQITLEEIIEDGCMDFQKCQLERGLMLEYSDKTIDMIIDIDFGNNMLTLFDFVGRDPSKSGKNVLPIDAIVANIRERNIKIIESFTMKDVKHKLN